MPCTFAIMAITKLTIPEFLLLSRQHPVLDVRSPGEFDHAHIPGAHSLPLFSNEERKLVGTAYKQESKQRAVKIGLKYFGSNMVQMVEQVEQLVKHAAGEALPTVLVHCWRGGMRSAGVAWLLDLYGFKVYTLVGGYKAYRNWVLAQFEKNYNIQIVGGYTGSGKTEVLKAMKTKGAAVIDLEGLAHHKGSAFGALGQPAQPSQEFFENKLATELWQIQTSTATVANEDNGAPTVDPTIYLEDESQRIGMVNIPTIFFQQMRQKKVWFLEIPFDERLDFIVANYGKFDKAQLINAVVRVKKKLGGLETKIAVNALIEDDIRLSFAVMLKYYDKLYNKGLLKREDPDHQVQTIFCNTVNADANAISIMRLAI